MPQPSTISTQTRRKYFFRYFQAGGMPEKVVELLSDNYTAVAQTVNLLAEWLIMCGKSSMQT